MLLTPWASTRLSVDSVQLLVLSLESELTGQIGLRMLSKPTGRVTHVAVLQLQGGAWPSHDAPLSPPQPLGTREEVGLSLPGPSPQSCYSFLKTTTTKKNTLYCNII